MSTLKEKREKITNLLIKFYDGIDPTKANSKHFLAQTNKMSDAQFIAYFTQLTSDPKSHLYIEFDAFKNEPTFDMVEDVINKVVGDKYCHLYDYIAFPSLSDDKSKPYVTANKIFNGYVNVRRVQQIVTHKTHVPTSLEQRDAKTGQVHLGSKAARVSDAEHIGMLCQGMDRVIEELMGPRGGDPVARNSMEAQISANGMVELDMIPNQKINKPWLRTADTYFLSAGIETDILTKNGILYRTVLDRKAKSVDNLKNLKGEM